MAIFTYHINKDERGEFFADVRKGGCNGDTVSEIHGFQIFEDGFMKHKHDMDGLTDHLRSLFIMHDGDRIGTEEEAEAEASSTVLLADSRGNITLPNGDELLHQYPAGDYDSISATNPNLQHLHKALYDARECGEVPDVSVFTLPNGETFNIDTFGKDPQDDGKRTYEVKVIRTVTTYFYRDQPADSPEQAKVLAADHAARHVEQWQFMDVAYHAEISDE